MRSYFKKRQSIFIKLIHDQAAFTLDGMEALKAYMAEDTSAAVRLTTAEKQADEARRILIAELNKTFITPFDREDIHALAKELDDVIDMLDVIVNRMRVYHLAGVNPDLVEFASLIDESVHAVACESARENSASLTVMPVAASGCAPERAKTIL